VEGFSIRPYVPGQDDEVLLHISNTSRSGTPDFVPTTLEQFRTSQQSPGWTADGRFIAELGGNPVGAAGGHMDPKRADPVGHMRGPSVLPGFRRRGIGSALAGRVLGFLRSQGRERVRTMVEGWNKAGIAFLEKLGFKPVRQFSVMRRPLAGLPSGIGESRGAAIRTAGSSDEDVAMLVRLSNEAFREHFGHQDRTVEQWAFWARNHEKFGYVVRYTVARLGGEPVGYLMIVFSPRDNEQRGTKRGSLVSVGVLKPYRNRGVAKALMLEGMHWLTAQGLEEVQLKVDDDNVTGASDLYERLGFELVNTDTVYERPLDAAPKGPGPAR
jgi:mycothiol synthase